MRIQSQELHLNKSSTIASNINNLKDSIKRQKLKNTHMKKVNFKNGHINIRTFITSQIFASDKRLILFL